MKQKNEELGSTNCCACPGGKESRLHLRHPRLFDTIVVFYSFFEQTSGLLWEGESISPFLSWTLTTLTQLCLSYGFLNLTILCSRTSLLPWGNTSYIPQDFFLTVFFLVLISLSSLSAKSNPMSAATCLSVLSATTWHMASASYGLPRPGAGADRNAGNLNFLKALVCSCHSLVTAEYTFHSLHLNPSYTPQQFALFAFHADYSQNTSLKWTTYLHHIFAFSAFNLFFQTQAICLLSFHTVMRISPLIPPKLIPF